MQTSRCTPSDTPCWSSSGIHHTVRNTASLRRPQAQQCDFKIETPLIRTPYTVVCNRTIIFKCHFQNCYSPCSPILSLLLSSRRFQGPDCSALYAAAGRHLEAVLAVAEGGHLSRPPGAATQGHSRPPSRNGQDMMWLPQQEYWTCVFHILTKSDSSKYFSFCNTKLRIILFLV